MVQVLQRREDPRESTGKQFSNAIIGGLGQVSDFVQKRNALKLQEQKMAQENETAKRMGLDLSGIRDPETRQKLMVENLKGNQVRQNEGAKLRGQQESERQNISALEKTLGLKEGSLSGFNSYDQALNAVKAQQSGQKTNEKNIEHDQVKQTAQNAFNGLVGLLNKNNVGLGAGLISSLPFAYETQKDIGEFSSLTGGLESMLVDMVSRGTLSNSRFQYITETLLPKPDDPQETIKGKLMGLSEILGLDPSSLIGESGEENELGNEKPEGNKTLDATAMKKIFDLSGGEKEKAKKIAKKMGYTL